MNEEVFSNDINLKNIKFSKDVIVEQNWNALWESNFQPVIINNTVAVRAHFHQPIKNVEHEIIITPKMSFGTGHHATTYMMVEQILKLDVRNKTVFDFGTGTGLLAVLAEKLGAAHIVAIDNDEWSINNASENILQNNCTKVELILKHQPPGNKKFDIVLANINKNVIEENFEILANLLSNNGCLILSGLLETDEPDILLRSSKYNIRFTQSCNRNNWLMMQFNKAV